MGFGIQRKVAQSDIFNRQGLALALFAACSLSSQVAAQSAAKAEPEPPTGSVGGMGDVNLYPKRVVIDQRQRVASVGLFNRASAAGEYDINISDMMMTTEGGLIELASVTDPAERDRVKTASALLKWSPRRVVLGSHDSQTVRIMARIAPDLPPGEYRSHFFAVAKPPAGSGGISIEQASGTRQPNAIGITIVPRFGISIPVIVRVGETTLAAGFRDLRIMTRPDGVKVISMTVTRSGTRSAFGDITVTAAGSKTKVVEIKGVGVYPEVTQRTIQIPLNPEIDPRLIERGARLTATYTDDDVAPGKTLAQQDFTVP
jgi:hypothetical protein